MRIAVVTGASSGLGREFARQIAAQGGIDEIWAIARREERLRALGEELSVPVRAVALDLTKGEDLAAYRALLESEKPDVRRLVNASGYAKFGDCFAVSPEDSAGMIALNCTALTVLTQVTLPFCAPGAEIYEIASIAAFQPVPCLGVYAATKAYVLSYARSLSRELAKRGVRVVAVCPGWMKTEFFSRAEETGRCITYFDCFHEPRDVVARALADCKKGRTVSVHGARTRFQRLLVKLLPHRLVMRVWEMQQHF